MSTIIDDIERSQLRSGLPDFSPGDRVRVHFLVIEGNRSRPQVFEGVVIKRQGSGVRETFTVRKQSFGVGVERTFPLHSPKIEKLEVASRGRVRRAKLYYLRGRTGKAARVSERRWGIDEEVLGTEAVGAVDASGEGLAPEEVPEEAPVEAVEGEVSEGDAGEQGSEAESVTGAEGEGPSEAAPEADSQADGDEEADTAPTEDGQAEEAPAADDTGSDAADQEEAREED